MKPLKIFRGFPIISLVLCSVLVLGFAHTPTDPTLEEDMLSFTLSLDRESYSDSDPISVNFKLTNNGANSVVVNGRFALNTAISVPSEFGDIYCLISKPSSKVARFGAYVNVVDLNSRHFVTLGSTEMIERTYPNLDDFYDFNEFGRYSIQAIYENQSDPPSGVVAWKGELASNVVYFSIKP